MEQRREYWSIQPTSAAYGGELGSKAYGVYRIRPATGETEPQKLKKQSRKFRNRYGNDYATCEYQGRNWYGVSNSNNEGSKTVAPTKHMHTNYGELKSHTALNRGISHLNSARSVTEASTKNFNKDGSKTVASTKHVYNNCGELLSHTTLTNMGISHPNSEVPTKDVHTTEGEPIPHTAPTEGNLVNIPIIYVEKKEPNSSYVSETPEQQTQEINAPRKPKPKKRT